MSILTEVEMIRLFAKLSESANIIPYIALGATAVLFALSWAISVKVYAKRDL